MFFMVHQTITIAPSLRPETLTLSESFNQNRQMAVMKNRAVNGLLILSAPLRLRVFAVKKILNSYGTYLPLSDPVVCGPWSSP
jgi:hypothetical protein